VKRGELTPILERYWPRNVLYAVHTAERPVPPKIRAFIDLIKKRLPAEL
jgi:DNA-binding transcriptional LysR family regulator